MTGKSNITLLVAVVLLVGVTPPSSAQASTGCRAGFKRLGSENCYLFNKNAYRTWKNARAYCLGLGAVLLEIETPNEQSVIVSELELQNMGSVWTGGNDIQNEGVWRWENKPIGSYTAWYGTNPSNSDDNEDCLELRNDEHFRWNDIDCNAGNHVVCEHA
ncbi:hypothetical protein BsWGS_24832 [Bradybaena similaris]